MEAFFPSCFVWVPGLMLMLSGLLSKYLYLISHLPAPDSKVYNNLGLRHNFSRRGQRLWPLAEQTPEERKPGDCAGSRAKAYRLTV